MSDNDTPWLDGIDGDALPRLIIADSPVIRVVAGPGSGKTTGLKRRVQRLVQGEGVSPSKIFVGTFTRAIAAELAEAFGVSVTADELGEGVVAAEIVEVATLHSHALRLVRANPTSRPGRILRFLLGYERDAMLYDIGARLPTFPKQNQRKNELNRISAAWADGADLAIAGFVGEMDRWLRRHGGMLIDEVVNIARLGLESGDVDAGEFNHVIIDEYQDLTAAEQQLVEKIWSRNGSLVVLGDDDQSIYRFRYNHPDGIAEFADRWKDEPLLDLSIPDNRRCGRVIVDLANAMMAQAGSSKAPMISRRGEEGELSLVYWPSLSQEINGLAKYMREQKDTRFLVLVPRRFIGYRLKDKIGDDALTAFHEEVLEIPLVQERFALACLAANAADGVAMRTVLGFHSDGNQHGPKRNAAAYQSIVDSELVGVELLEAIEIGELKVSGQGSTHLRARAELALVFFREIGDDSHEVIDVLFDPALATAAGSDKEKRDKAKRDLEQLWTSAHAIHNKNVVGDFAKTLDTLRYRIAMRIPLTDPTVARVNIMTLHGAKGLEADVVIVAGVADQIIPGHLPEQPSEAEAIREEQRRLLYVSATRAKKELIISWPKEIDYKEATRNNVRLDGGIRRQGDRKLVKLGRTALLPDIEAQATTGNRWLKDKLSS
jgi:superfamily I DNA/RNA helicase